MNKRRSFTLIEILIGLCILSALATFSVLAIRYYYEKSKSAEAIITAGHISKAEEAKKLENGSYIAADSTQEINERLGMGIVSKDYEYRVVGVTDENFIVLAQRIGLDIQEGRMPEPPVLLAMDRSGVIPGVYQPNDLGGISGGGQPGVGIGGGLGGAGGGSGGSGGGGGGGGGGGSGGSSGGGSRHSVRSNTAQVYNADIAASLEKLKSLTDPLFDANGNEMESGEYFYDLIIDNNIPVSYVTIPPPDPAQPLLWIMARWDPTLKIIEVNERIKTLADWPEEAVACVILHEAVHADFSYNPEKWAGRIMDQWGADYAYLAEDKLYDPGEFFPYEDPDGNLIVKPALYYSQTEEYFTHSLEAAAWESLKGNYSNINLDTILGAYNSGEGGLTTYITGYEDYAALPKFYEGEPN